MPDKPAPDKIVSLKPRFRLPEDDHRLCILGRTGSGKTHFASWVLSQANWPKRPWIIVDYKHDPLLAELPTEEIGVADRRLPKHPGLYVVHPGPKATSDDQVEAMVWRIWEKGRTGLYIDEGHIMPDQGALQGVLTQGRTKKIPVIMLTQRPKWLNRFILSEADFYALFHLNDRQDRTRIGELLPEQAKDPLPRRHAWYYDVENNHLFHLTPAPPRNVILDTFERRKPGRVKTRMI